MGYGFSCFHIVWLWRHHKPVHWTSTALKYRASKAGFFFNSVRIWWSWKLAKFGVLLATTVSKYSKNYLVKINIYLYIFEKVVLQFAKKMLDFLRNLRLACMRNLCGKKKIRHQENFLSYGQCFLAVLFPGLRISRGIFNSFSVRYLWCRKQLTLASRQEDKLQLKIDRSLFILLLRLFTIQKTEPSTNFSVQYNNCLITHCQSFWNSMLWTANVYVMNCINF